jgi:hypothetical protein
LFPTVQVAYGRSIDTHHGLADGVTEGVVVVDVVGVTDLVVDGVAVAVVVGVIDGVADLVEVGVTDGVAALVEVGVTDAALWQFIMEFLVKRQSSYK